MNRPRTLPEPMEPRWYRVEWGDGGATVVLGRVPDVFPHPSSLTPWIARARRVGGGGMFLLIEEESGKVVARRRVTPPPTP